MFSEKTFHETTYCNHSSGQDEEWKNHKLRSVTGQFGFLLLFLEILIFSLYMYGMYHMCLYILGARRLRYLSALLNGRRGGFCVAEGERKGRKRKGKEGLLHAFSSSSSWLSLLLLPCRTSVYLKRRDTEGEKKEHSLLRFPFFFCAKKEGETTREG